MGAIDKSRAVVEGSVASDRDSKLSDQDGSWRYLAASERGSSHVEDGTPCQDHLEIRLLDQDAATGLIACVADGAGSAKFGGAGAAIACRVMVNELSAFHEQFQSFHKLTINDVVQMCELARREIAIEAEARQAMPRDFATTLAVAALSDDAAVLFQIGDGAVVIRRHQVYGVVIWPQSGEYINSTFFLTGPDFDKHLEVVQIAGPIREIALMTDGMTAMALSLQQQVPHPPFFNPFFDALQADADSSTLRAEFRQFLNSSIVQARSDDDKSLIIAARG